MGVYTRHLSLSLPPRIELRCICTKNSEQIFPEMKLRGLVPNFYIHVYGSNLYIPTIGLPILLYCVAVLRSWEYINRSQIHECRNWERGCTVSFVGYLFRIFGTVQLQCIYLYTNQPPPPPHFLLKVLNSGTEFTLFSRSSFISLLQNS